MTRFQAYLFWLMVGIGVTMVVIAGSNSHYVRETNEISRELWHLVGYLFFTMIAVTFVGLVNVIIQLVRRKWKAALRGLGILLLLPFFYILTVLVNPGSFV